MKKINIVVFNNSERELLHLDNIIELNKRLKKAINDEDSIYKFVAVSDKDKLELGLFMNMFNNLLGFSIFDCCISTENDTIIYNEPAKEIKEHNIIEKNVKSINNGLEVIIESYKKDNNLGDIYFISDNKDSISNNVFNRYDIKYIKYQDNLFDTLFKLI